MSTKQHKFAPWRRAILVPFWTLQILFMIIIIGLLTLAVGVLVTYDKNQDYGFGSADDEVDDAVDTATKVVGPIWISLSVICLLFTITEIIMLTRRKLTPLKFLVMNVIKSTIWTALFILDIIAYATAGGRTETALGVVVELVLVLSFWIPLIYGSIIYHRFRKEKKSYKPLAHPLSNPAADTSYPSQYSGFANTAPQQHRDLESQPYGSQVSGTTSYNNERYDTYKQGNSHGDVGLAHHSPSLMSPRVPQVVVQHHDTGVYEMDNSRRNLG